MFNIIFFLLRIHQTIIFQINSLLFVSKLKNNFCVSFLIFFFTFGLISMVQFLGIMYDYLENIKIL